MKTAASPLVLSMLAACWLTGCASVSPAPSAPDPRTVVVADRLAAEHEAGRFDGLALVADGDDVLWRRAYGPADRERGVAHDLDRPFRWASVTKQVVGVLVMQAVDEGRLDLGDTVADALPAFTGPTGGEITIEDLLRHRSGLPNPDDSPPNADGVPSFYRPTTGRVLGNRPAAQEYCAGEPKSEPRTGFEYNNCDYLVLGAILEGIYDRIFEEIVRERLAEPLDAPSLRIAGDDTFTGYLENGSPEPAYDLQTYGAGAAMTGTLDDLWAFDRALMDGELLSPEARETLWAGDPSAGYVALGAWSFPAQPTGCAEPLHLVERQGAIGGLRVLNLLVPERRIAIVLVSNTATTDYGAIWRGSGLAHDLLQAAGCSPETP